MQFWKCLSNVTDLLLRYIEAMIWSDAIRFYEFEKVMMKSREKTRNTGHKHFVSNRTKFMVFNLNLKEYFKVESSFRTGLSYQNLFSQNGYYDLKKWIGLQVFDFIC